MATVRKAKEAGPNHFINDAKTLIDTPLNMEVSKSFMEYSLSVVFSRALVSATDGLKPVGRRILFSMFRDGYTPEKNYVKSARTVGNVMATLHPHGDCLDGATKVLGLDGKSYNLKELHESGIKELWVSATDKDGNVVPARAHSFRIGQMATKIYEVSLSDSGIIKATGNHPFRLIDGTWVKAENLTSGMELSSALSSEKGILEDPSLGTTVTDIRIDTLETAIPMYDFTVDEHENMMIVSSEKEGSYSLISVHNSSIYDAMVKLAQPWYTNVKYVDGYGNWGDAGGSGPAAARYTESKLDKNALLMLSEIKENTVDMKANYDGEDEEPVVLPVQFPALVINGTFGLAVGFASNMAPHNPTEVLDACRWLLTHPNADLDKIMTFIPGPDFPTGGQILGMDAVREAYETGKGIIKIRATYHVETLGRGKHNIVFTEMPYGVKTENIIAKIKDGIKNNKLQGIADVKDLTDRRNGIRLVVETKAGVNPEPLVLDLYKNTPLEDSFGINNVALVKEERNGKFYDVPKTLGLKEQLDIFIDHRIDVVTRRSQHRKDKRDARLHIIEGMLKALANIDEVIKIIRAAADSAVAQANLIKRFKIDEIQADYILAIPLRRLTKFDQIELNEEKIKLTGEVKELEKILTDDKALRGVIADELSAVRKQLDRPRKSVLVGGSLAEHIEEAKKVAKSATLEVADEPCKVFVTRNGAFIRSTKDKLAGAISEASTTTRGKFIAVTSKGRAFRIDALHVGEKVTPASAVLPEKLASGEKIIAVTPVALAEGSIGGIAIGTKQGIVKVQDPKGFPKTQDEFSVIGLQDGDEILSARWMEDQSKYTLCFIKSSSNLLHFPASTVRAQGATSGGGVLGVKAEADAEVIDFSVISDEEAEKALVISVSDAGNAKFTPFKLYPGKGRGSLGIRTLKLLKGETTVAYSTVAVDPVLVTADGTKLEPLPTDNRRDGSGKPFGIPVK